MPPPRDSPATACWPWRWLPALPPTGGALCRPCPAVRRKVGCRRWGVSDPAHGANLRPQGRCGVAHAPASVTPLVRDIRVRIVSERRPDRRRFSSADTRCVAQRLERACRRACISARTVDSGDTFGSHSGLACARGSDPFLPTQTAVTGPRATVQGDERCAGHSVHFVMSHRTFLECTRSIVLKYRFELPFVP
jgi:hypothetical protein